MSRSPVLSLALFPLAATAFACGEPAPSPPHEEVPPAPADTIRVAAAAPGDSVIAWANDIRTGIAPLPGQVEIDPVAARQRAVELYVTRQERIEQTVGPGTEAAPDLAEAVDVAETTFHELMQLLGESPPPDSARVADAVRSLDARIGDVTDLVNRPAAAGARAVTGTQAGSR